MLVAAAVVEGYRTVAMAAAAVVERPL